MTLRERVARVRDVAPMSECSAADLQELEDELQRAESLEDLPGRWQAVVLEAEAGAKSQSE